MQPDAGFSGNEAHDIFADFFGIDQDKPCVAKYFDPMIEEEEIQVVDTDGNVIGVIDLTHDWIRL